MRLRDQKPPPTAPTSALTYCYSWIMPMYTTKRTGKRILFELPISTTRAAAICTEDSLQRSLSIAQVQAKTILRPIFHFFEQFKKMYGNTLLSVWDQEIIYFSIILLFVSRAMNLKDMDDRLLLFEDERLTLDIDEVMAIYVIWKGL